MEFLQTIWTSLMTPNEGLIKILFIPLAFLDAFASMYYFTTILNISVSRKKKLLYVLIYSIIGIAITYIVPTSYAIFVNIIALPLTIFFVLKTTVVKSILAEVIILVTTSVLDLIFSGIFLNIFNVTYDILMVTPLYRVICVVSIYLILIFIASIIKYLKVNIKVIDNMNKKIKIFILINILLLILVIATQFYLVRFYSGNVPYIITIIGVLALVAYFIVSIYNLISISKLTIAERDLEDAQLTIRTQRVLFDTVRTFKHDFDNIVNSIGGYIRDENPEGLEKYYNQLLEECGKTNNLYSLSPDVINHPAIYNILATKYYDADELNVAINLDIFLDLNEIEKHMKIYEFTRILGILLDNAIEATKECEEKKINVVFRREENRHRLVIIIENTYNNRDVDIDKIFDKGESSKEGNSGLGLWKVRQILKRNNNLNLYTTKNSEYFKQQFEIYY